MGSHRIARYGARMQDTATSMDELATALGHAAIAWGWLQESLGHLYSAVCYGSLSDTALACWHSIENDRAQRGMLTAAANTELNTRPDVQRYIVDLVNIVNDRSDMRNNYIHASYTTLIKIDGKTVPIPFSYYGNKRSTKLQAKSVEGNILEELSEFRKTVEQLSDASDAAYQWIIDEECIPSIRQIGSRSIGGAVS